MTIIAKLSLAQSKQNLAIKSKVLVFTKRNLTGWESFVNEKEILYT